jgi:uncharacterized protein YndB with AHSA1/START domain
MTQVRLKPAGIAPVRKSVTVRATPSHAFDVFVNGIDLWWPKDHSIGNAPITRSVIEPWLGGRWYSTHEDGQTCVSGRVLAWEPPSRLVLSWEINAAWKPDTSIASEVEVRFVPEGAGLTRVELEHRNFDTLGEGARSLRDTVDHGWPDILDRFRGITEG